MIGKIIATRNLPEAVFQAKILTVLVEHRFVPAGPAGG